MMRTFPTLIKKKYYSLRNKQKTMHTAFVHMNCCLFYIFFFLFNVTLYFSLFLYVYSILYIYSFTQHNMCKRLLYCDAHAVDGGTMCFRVHNWWWSANSKMIRRWCDDCFDCEWQWMTSDEWRKIRWNEYKNNKKRNYAKKERSWMGMFVFFSLLLQLLDGFCCFVTDKWFPLNFNHSIWVDHRFDVIVAQFWSSFNSWHFYFDVPVMTLHVGLELWTKKIQCFVRLKEYDLWIDWTSNISIGQ